MNNWYIAKLVYKVVCGNGQHRPQYDEQWRLIQANDAGRALTKATALGKNESVNDDSFSQPVEWYFITVAALIPLNTLAEGAEILSTTREPWDETAYRTELQKESAHLTRHLHSLALSVS